MLLVLNYDIINYDIRKEDKMKENIIIAIKGFIIGIANIIPGVSGGTLAITLGLYERIINTITHFFTNIKENIKFLIPLGIGAVLSILILSRLIGTCLEEYPFPTTLFFIGLILGGVPLLTKKIKGQTGKISNWIIFFITAGIVLALAFLKSGDAYVSLENLNLTGYLLLFLIGILAAATMVIPGISGSFMLMILGYYKPIIDTISNLTKFENIMQNILVLIPFGIGVLVGIILVAKLIEHLLKKFEIQTYFGIIGFVIASIVSIIKPLIGISISSFQIIIGIILLLIGAALAYRLGEE